MKRNAVLLGLLAIGVSLAAASLAPAADPAARIPVILDTDIGDDIDDTWALALLLKSPEVDLKLVVSDTGDTVYRAKLLAKLLEVAGRTDVPVGVGVRQKPEGRQNQGAWVADYDLAKYPGKVYDDGVAAMIDLIMASPEKITLLCIGPVPNIAAALARKPEIAERVQFVGMHGSVKVGYGGASEPSKEWNVVCDAPACQKAFTAAWPMTITPLDTCGLVQLRGEKYARMEASQDPIARAVVENYHIWLKSHGKSADKVEASSTLFDTVAAYLTFSTDLVNMETHPLVVTDDGFTRIDPSGKPVACAMSWKDLSAYESFLVERLTNKKP